VRLVEHEGDVADLDIPDGTPVALLAQTTLSQHDWAGVLDKARDRFPELWMPGRSDLCFATTNRQDTLTALASRVDAVVVIGSANSSNTMALVKTAHNAGCDHVLRVNSADEVPDDLHGVVGVTAGASAPEELVAAVIERLAPIEGVEEVSVTDEDEYFPPPAELRQLLRGLVGALSLTLGAPLGGDGVLATDREVPASAVLAGLVP